jgi:hypothetical protein
MWRGAGGKIFFWGPALGTPDAKIAMGAEVANTHESIVPQSIDELAATSKNGKIWYTKGLVAPF